mmetsp:Transcript_40027/g.86425  ORF Transcript_40027/g.86425 Transcript_40027/m.86425 type:complete len:198 (-) Transcript_40027:26-619(-)
MPGEGATAEVGGTTGTATGTATETGGIRGRDRFGGAETGTEIDESLVEATPEAVGDDDEMGVHSRGSEDSQPPNNNTVSNSNNTNFKPFEEDEEEEEDAEPSNYCRSTQEGPNKEARCHVMTVTSCVGSSLFEATSDSTQPSRQGWVQVQPRRERRRKLPAETTQLNEDAVRQAKQSKLPRRFFCERKAPRFAVRMC